SELQLILKDSRGRFDLVIVDTPSLSSCNDALLLEELADGIILVTRQAITRSSLLSEATDQLIEAEVKILGAVINYVDITPTLNTAEPELPPLIVPPLQEQTQTEEVKVEV
ncbi:MAG: ATPase, partial [Microcystis sp. M53601_WE4]|nr:ATPase [Microcystis sp. M53601_WE4]